PLPVAGRGRSVRPVFRHEKFGVELLFRAARLGLPVVAPLYPRRQRYQDRLGATAGLQPEQRTAVVHQIELDVAPATIGLERALALAIGKIAAALDDRQISRQEPFSHASRQREASGEIGRVEIVEKNAAHPARLGAMAEIEIIVAPLLIARVALRAER